ncbi:hypothetical protein B7494_g587 [Chlorociboria aeruginascens]|nr:hypothetical protein B7494_g587 [Chlorociboria aeruginascens]
MSDAPPIDLIPAEQDISMELRTTSTLQEQDTSKTNPTERADERYIAFYYDKSYVGCPYKAVVYDTRQYFVVTRQTMTYLNQPYPAELLRLVTHPKIQRMIYGFTLRARKYSHVAPSTVSSNWSGKWSLPHYRVASPLGMSSDNWERDISRIQRVDHLVPYTEIRRVVRRPIDATILRVSKWTNLIGNEMLYGENPFIFRMCNGSFYDSPPTLLRENVLIRPSPAKPKLDKTWFKNVKLGMVQVKSGTHMRQLLGWVYYDGFLRFLHSIGSKNAALITRLKFCGTILIHKCDFECSPGCDDDLLKSIRLYVPFIEKFCPNLRTLTLCVRLDPKYNEEGEKKDDNEKETPFGIPPTPPTTAPSPNTPVYSSAVEDGPFAKTGAYFGPTNFSAVFLENRENFGNTGIQLSSDSDPYIPCHDSLQPQTYFMLPGPTRVGLGIKVLRQLPDRYTTNFLLEWHSEKCDETTFFKPAIKPFANSLWATFGTHLKEPRRSEDLEHISAAVCKNGETALEEFEDYEPWLASLSGTNLRWETIGTIFAVLSNALLSLPERDAFFSTQRGQRCNRRQFAVEMKDCVQACIVLSNYKDLLNLQMLALLVKNWALQTIISGETSLLNWRLLGDLVSASTALGLHRQVDSEQVTFLSELKRRTFTAIFKIDKGASLFVGRPPALSYRYTKFKFPLDLSDEVLVSGGEDLVKAIKNMGANGYHQTAEIYPSTQMRCQGSLAIVLEDILELTLGDPAEETLDRIQSLLDRINNTYDSFPSFTKFHPSDPSDPAVSDAILAKRISLRLRFLERRLPLERLAYKHSNAAGQNMIDCAREMLELTVLLWVQRDKFTEHHHDYDWLIICMGVPSSGVLCIELLKQTKNQTPDPNIFLPRSEIVQNLSLLVGFLEWLKPATGNYPVLLRMRLIIKRILDQILNSAPPPTGSQAQNQNQNHVRDHIQNQISDQDQGQDMQVQLGEPTSGNGNGIAYGGTGWEGFDTDFLDTPGSFEDGLENLDWLGSVDWSRGPWINLDCLS